MRQDTSEIISIMIIAYLQVSTGRQHFENQEEEIFR